ncbi:MAG: hypothetical protein L0221_04365, partial [Chloroflexi bacterium]|nr:hypothetical protein [Chloroflexota bacterium]
MLWALPLALHADRAPAVCGNGIVEAREECDDGNDLAGDCCAPGCRLEPDGGACSDRACGGPGVCSAGSCRREANACDELPLLRAASSRPVEASFANGIARSVLGRIPAPGRDPVARARGFLERFRDLYGLDDPNLALRVRRVKTYLDGTERVLFYQTFRGLPVVPAELLLTLRDGEVVSTIGGVLPRSVKLDTQPRISADAARAIARRRGGGASRDVATSLVVWDRGLFGTVPSDPRLAWRVALRNSTTGLVLVDAHRGEVLVTLPAAQSHGLDYVVHDAENTANLIDSPCFDVSFEPVVADDEEGLFPDYVGDFEAEQATIATVNTWNWWHQKFGRHSYDD